MTEVSLLLALVVIAAIIMLSLFGSKISGMLACVVHDFQQQNCTANDIPSAGGFTPGAGYSAAVGADHPVAYWRLDDSGTNIADASGNGHNGILSGSVVEGVPGALSGGTDKAVIFNGSDTGVSANTGALGANWTMEAWVETSVASEMQIVDAAPVEFYLATDGNLVAKVAGVGTVQTFIVTPGLKNGNWHYVVVTDDGASIALYIDGQPRASSGTLAGGASVTDATIYVGRTGAGTGYFDGVLDEVAVYDAALSPERVYAHFLASGV